VDVEIAAEILAGLELGSGHHLAAVVCAGVVPFERTGQVMIHANVEVEHDEDRRLQPVGKVEGVGAKLEGLGRILREQQYVLGVAVRSISARDQVALLGARRHAGRGAGPLHVKDDGGDFRKIGKARNSCISEMPGPDVAVKARAPFQAAPITMPIEANSSSACTIATLFLLVTGSTRSRLQWLVKASASEDDGLIGYQAHTLAAP